MTISSYLAALCCLIVVGLASVMTGRRLRRRLVPSWDGAVGVLATAVLSLGGLIVLAELLGSIGELRRWVLVGVAAAVVLIARLAAPLDEPLLPDVIRPPRTVAGMIAIGSACVVAGQLLVAVHTVGTTGITFIDSVEYHLTYAAHIAVSGRTTGILHVSPGDATAYYPLNDELLHAIGMILVGRDSLSVLLSGIDLALAGLAAYAIGDEFGAGPRNG